ncbi:YnbE family lipoprotein [Shumkonia mesophila]|uniref:YnbE family lipoprotein n=1 Tax=Shumkonia mesophila TaxID=2838854 RepID=UPI002934BA71|nr:YnbE family lipoprotein [Shumkonia mesophila]
MLHNLLIMAIQMQSVSTLAQGAPRPTWGVALLALVMLAACEPTIRVQPPSEPITINLNVKVDAEVRVKLERQAADDIRKNDDIF